MIGEVGKLDPAVELPLLLVQGDEDIPFPSPERLSPTRMLEPTGLGRQVTRPSAQTLELGMTYDGLTNTNQGDESPSASRKVRNTSLKGNRDRPLTAQNNRLRKITG